MRIIEIWREVESGMDCGYREGVGGGFLFKGNKVRGKELVIKIVDF